ncbi:hypothetical protein GGI07_002079 [Coemansia sp. Benny D115]|nr:hypothetical protein GGI07_002079 [Coemansia sp. Benny D115]
MDPLSPLYTAAAKASAYAFPALVAAAAVYVATTYVSAALRERRRNSARVTDKEKRLEAINRRLAQQQASAEQGDEQEGDAQPAPAISSVLRSHLPSGSSRPFGSNATSFGEARSRFSGPSHPGLLSTGDIGGPVMVHY